MTKMAKPLRTRPSKIILAYSNVPVADSNSIATTLLAPPTTPLTKRDIPFKPTDSDEISLSMKKRHGNKHFSQRPGRHQTRTLSNDGITFGDSVSDAESAHMARSRSMPSLEQCSKYNGFDDPSLKRDDTPRTPASGQSRRWTLPSKAHPTKGLTTLKSVVKHKTSRKKPEDTESSPALITLRRATHKPPRQTSLTFFPTPTFSRTKSSFASYFLQSITRGTEHTTENIDFLVNEVRRDSSDRSPKLVAGAPQPSLSAMADPLLTEILSNVSVTSTAADRRRRCSTRYVSGASVYEVIWDENDSPSNTSDSLPPPNAITETTQTRNFSANRRESAAMDKLETQLFKAIAQSRRESHISQHAEYIPRRQSFQSLVNMKFSRLFNETALYSLPRSKASRLLKRSNSISISAAAAVQQTFDDESHISPQDDIEFFPPLQTLSTTNTSSSTADHKVDQMNGRISIETGRSRMGSMLGASGHVRRPSLKNDVKPRQKNRTFKNWKKSGGVRPSNQVVGGETKPLLNVSSWEGENPW